MINLKHFFRGSFIKNVVVVAGGTIFTQFLNAVLTPIITRIYTPAEYGVVTLYLSVLSMMVVICSLKYEWGIPIADNDEKAINVLGLCVVILTGTTLIVFMLLFLVNDVYLTNIIGEKLINYKYYVPVGIFFAGLYNIFLQWNYREKTFNVITKTKITQALAQSLSKIGLGLLNIGSIGLIIGTILGHSSGLTALSKNLFLSKKRLIKKINKNEILWCAKRYKDYPIYSATSQFMNSAGLNLPQIFLALLFSSQVTGAFGLASSMIGMPVTLIGKSVGDVYYAEVASIGKTNPKRLMSLSNELIKRLVLIALFPTLFLLFFGPLFFSIVFGVKWIEAGVYSRIMSLLIFFRLVFLPTSRIFAAMEKQKQALLLDFIRLALVLVVFQLSKILSLNSYWTIGLYTIAMSFVYLLTFLFARKIISNQIKILECEK